MGWHIGYTPMDSSYSNKIYPDRETLLRILDHMYDELFVISDDGVILYVNQACERHYGVKPEEMIGKTVTECSEQGYWYPPVSPIALRTKKIATYEQTTNTGRKLLVTVTPVFNDQGELEMVVENLRDIPKLEEIKTDLEQTKRMLLRYKQEVEELRHKELNQNFVAQSEAIKDILRLARRIADVDPTVLVTGETGTGKGLLVKYIHRVSPRKSGPFITVNCAAVPDQLLESELYGYSAGAFTGADPKGKIGLVELAEGGTLFLDEISEIPLHLQAKLLQMIQDRKYIPVGGTKYTSVNCRIISATNQDLARLVEEGKFRKDLFYRLNTIEIDMPPLRDRREDIIPLAQFFLNKFDRQYKMEHYFAAEAITALIDYAWPGNVRELENLIERLTVTVRDPIIEPGHLPFNLPTTTVDFIPGQGETFPLDEALRKLEEQSISRAYGKYGSSYKAAEALGISQSRAYRLIRKYGVRKL